MDKEIYLIISKYLTGRCNKQEAAFLRDWLAQSEDNQTYFDEMRSLWQNTTIKDHFSNKETVFDKILNEIQVDGDHGALERGNTSIHHYQRTAFIAASILIFLSLSLSYFLFKNLRPAAENVIEIKWQKKVNPSGQKSKIFLPDGTIAFLNAESSIKYIAEFTDSARDIYLEGEAFFDVKKDPTKPFRVHSSNFNVTALGTKFNVNSFLDETSSVISLVEGKVSVRSKLHNEILSPGESLLINNKQVVRFETNLENTAWKDGILIFDGDNLEEMIKKLERWYGVNIGVIGTPDRSMRYNGVFKNEYLTNVLESMRYGREFDFTIDGKNVVLNF